MAEGNSIGVRPIEGQLTKVRRTVEDVARSREGKLAAGAATVAAAAVAARRLRDGSKDDGADRRLRYRLRPEGPVGREVRRVASGRIDHAVELLRDPGAEPATVVHEARKDMKKLRSALRLVRPVVGDAVYDRENERFRDAARALSEARDAKVLSETVDGLAERFADDPPPGGWGSVHRALTPGEDGSDLGELRRTAADRIEAGRREIEILSLPGTPDDVLRPGVERTYERGRRRLREATAETTDECQHELRKRVKDLWYQLRLLRDASRDLVEPLEDQADELSDLLGDDHDLAVLRARLDDADSLSGAQRRHLARLIAGRRSKLQRKALACAERLYARKPKEFARRVTEPWEAAHQV
ncbi:MAG: CHAD domain-containing protein [Solirubrobacterales bacterium]